MCECLFSSYQFNFKHLGKSENVLFSLLHKSIQCVIMFL